MDETFLLSNIAPQVGAGFNRHCTFFQLVFYGVPNAISNELPLPLCVLDWAYLEDWCRRLTNSFADVYVFTIPLYLPQKDKDGKSRVVSEHIIYSP
jgi:endonuclease G